MAGVIYKLFPPEFAGRAYKYQPPATRSTILKYGKEKTLMDVVRSENKNNETYINITFLIGLF